MYRSRTKISYEILHGIDIHSNRSTMLAYLSYFPPPPPLMPGPPPQRSWTCSLQSLSSASCLISDDLNPSNLRQYVPSISTNQSFPSTNTSWNTNSTTDSPLPSLSLLSFFQNQLTLILLFLIFLSLLFFVIALLFLCLYIQRLRQRQLTSTSHLQTNNNNNNNNNNNSALNNNNNPKVYYQLKAHRRSKGSRNLSEGNNILRLSNHDSPVLEVRRLSKSRNTHVEQEEIL